MTPVTIEMKTTPTGNPEKMVLESWPMMVSWVYPLPTGLPASVSWLPGNSAYLMPVSFTSVMMDIIIVTETTPIRSRVVAAFVLLGFLNAGTPLEMASTPVSAALPDEKARSSRKIMAKPASPPAPCSGNRPNRALSA